MNQKKQVIFTFVTRQYYHWKNQEKQKWTEYFSRTFIITKFTFLIKQGWIQFDKHGYRMSHTTFGWCIQLLQILSMSPVPDSYQNISSRYLSLNIFHCTGMNILSRFVQGKKECYIFSTIGYLPKEIVLLNWNFSYKTF